MVYKVVTTEYFVEDPDKVNNFILLCRDLWNDYAWCAREHIIASSNNVPDELTQVRNRIQANLAGIAKVIDDYYSETQGKRFRDYLEGLYTLQIELLDYVKKPPVNFSFTTDKYVQEIREKMDTIVSDIFDFMATANPGSWNKLYVRNLVYDIKESWLSQVMMRYGKNWLEDLQALDRMFDFTRRMGQMFGEGITGQFPDRFAKPTAISPPTTVI